MLYKLGYWLWGGLAGAVAGESLLLLSDGSSFLLLADGAARLRRA